MNSTHRGIVLLAGAGLWLSACGDEPNIPTGPTGPEPLSGATMDERLVTSLGLSRITGRIEESLVAKLGRPLDDRLAEVGRLLFFDPILSITQDNSCSGCHGPNASFNGARSIAIGVGNNGVVGPGRSGPHNLRRAPTVINAAFYPNLMWDGRFSAASLDPFDNSLGFEFPEPEGRTLSRMEHLLGAQGFTPVVSREEMAGFDFQGDHDAMRTEIAGRVDAIAEYRARFAEVDPDIAAGDPISYDHIGQALAEFEFTLIRANAPIDQYARGDTSALSPEEKRGGMVFFRLREGCFECHISHGFANEMFSDFESHVLAVPQVTPDETNVLFDGPGRNEDFGLERHTGNPGDRYKFRTTPLRNVVYQPSFMHNGAFKCLEKAIRHHTDMLGSLEDFDGEELEPGLRASRGPVAPMIELAHHLSTNPMLLNDTEFTDLTTFVAVSLTDPEAHPDRLRSLIPSDVPSGLPVHDFDYETPMIGCS
jgi:cytochrome c peroxidase